MDTTSTSDQLLREHLVRTLSWEGAHQQFDSIVQKFPNDWVGRKVDGVPYSPWQLLEHIRLTQRDILDFCRDPDYEEPRWPDEYWPAEDAPPDPGDWHRAAEQFKADRSAFAELIADPQLDVFARIPHGDGQTYLREALLIIDHNAYHVGQMVVLWRLLGGA